MKLLTWQCNPCFHFIDYNIPLAIKVSRKIFNCLVFSWANLYGDKGITIWSQRRNSARLCARIIDISTVTFTEFQGYLSSWQNSLNSRICLNMLMHYILPGLYLSTELFWQLFSLVGYTRKLSIIPFLIKERCITFMTYCLRLESVYLKENSEVLIVNKWKGHWYMISVYLKISLHLCIWW